MRIVTAITGASGALLGTRFVRRAVELGATIDLVVSAAGARVLADELDFPPDPQKGAFRDFLGTAAASVRRHGEKDIGADIASGSVPTDGMAVIPCSMGTAARIAHGISGNLVERAADVTLKERRRLIVVPREAPLSTLHLENLLALARAGAVVLPAMPAFYAGATTLEQLADTIVDRALAFFFGPEAIRSRWTGGARAPARDRE